MNGSKFAIATILIVAVIVFVVYAIFSVKIPGIILQIKISSLQSSDVEKSAFVNVKQNTTDNYLRIVNGDADLPELFRYFEDTVNDNCTNLLTSHTEQLLYETYNLYINKHAEKLEKIENITLGTIEGNSMKYTSLTTLYLLLARQKWVVNVCEIGFNAGHSAIAWLTGSNRTLLYSFDLGNHYYARPMAEYIVSLFPGRISVILGDSKVTVPKFSSENKEKISCDVIVIDGDHSFDGALADLRNMRSLANSKNNIVILDDYPNTYPDMVKSVGPAWIQARQESFVGNVFNCICYTQPQAWGLHGFTLGYYK